MKKIYLLIPALISVCVARAQMRESENLFKKIWWDDKMLNIMLDMRVDLQGRAYHDGRDGQDDELSFHGQTLKLILSGEVVPGIRYRVRQRLNRPQAPLLREGYSSATDQAWLAFDFGRNKQWTITAGKQSIMFGTFEYDFNAADIYLASMVYNDMVSYQLGVSATYRLGAQTLNLQVVNSDYPMFAADASRNKALGIVTLWEGSLWEGLVKTRWSYAAMQHYKGKFYNWITAGVQLNLGKSTTELDYYYGDRMIDYASQVNLGDLGLRPVRDRSAVLSFQYRLGKFRPWLKGVWNQRFDRGYDQDAYRSWGAQVALEYYPFNNPRVKDLRFHVAYYFTDVDYMGLFSDIPHAGINTALIGFRWLFKAK